MFFHLTHLHEAVARIAATVYIVRRYLFPRYHADLTPFLRLEHRIGSSTTSMRRRLCAVQLVIFGHGIVAVGSRGFGLLTQIR